ncbi:MAG TPA: 30S ribosomal protein S18 [Candidatus Wildermuthbacteria bacterium]|nr:30S ribosomal protein S18 [Patescibacteria group bacterium]HEA84641.1 30S ribosomal protein S18 [Candidatus Wildermuthbacteria bacterium]
MDCYLCKRNIKEVDFKDTYTLNRFISGLGKIRPKKKTGLCASHQRKVTRAIKRSRTLGLLSATSK